MLWEVHLFPLACSEKTLAYFTLNFKTAFSAAQFFSLPNQDLHFIWAIFCVVKLANSTHLKDSLITTLTLCACDHTASVSLSRWSSLPCLKILWPSDLVDAVSANYVSFPYPSYNWT